MPDAIHGDPAWLERMYNARAAVPGHAQILQRWASDSAAARAASTCHLDVPYGQRPSERLDVFPGEPRRAPVLVFVHGGWWRSLDKSDYSFMAPAFVARGACVVGVNYALCPGTAGQPVTVPFIVRQLEQALVWLWTHVADYGGNPGNITLAGHSAGGHLVALLLASAWPLLSRRLPAVLVRKALAISGVYDLTPIRRTPFLQRDLHLTEQQVMRLSPALLPAPREAHLHCVVGGDESEEFQRQCSLMQRAWGSHYVPRADVLQGMDHYSIVDDLADPGGEVHQMAVNLLRL